MEETENRFNELKQTIIDNAPFGWRDYGHISKLECLQCENACAEAVEEIAELIDENPDFNPDLSEIIDALYDGYKDELAERLESYRELLKEE